MKEYNPDAIRNIGFIGHGGSGKTSITELLLFTAGEVNRLGHVDEGNTVSDFNANEIERRISISATTMHLDWEGTKINIIDTPGYSDFIGQVKAAMHVVDAAVAVVKSNDGVEVGTEASWAYVKEKNLPAAVIVNRSDNEHAKFNETFEEIKDRLSKDATVVSFPVNEGINFNMVVDLIKMKAITYDTAGTKKISETEIPASVKDDADSLREELIEKIAESDEELMNKFFEEGSLSDEEIKIGLRKAIASGNLVPVFAMAATKGVGANTFLSFVNNYFPSPLDVVKPTGKRDEQVIEVPFDASAETVIFIFKTLSEQHLGELSLFKVHSGVVHGGIDLVNIKKNKNERIGQIYVINGKNRQEATKLYAGDIGAVVKLKETKANDTLSTKIMNIIMDPIVFPSPVIRDAIEPKAKGDEDKISTGLHKIHEEDPSLTVHFDPELSQTIISGQGELQLALATKLLKDKYNVEVDLVEPKIPYRETIRGVCENAEFKHKKQSGGRGQYGHVILKLEPNERGKGFEFINAIVGGVVPGRFIPAVEKGLNEIILKGILTGSKVIDVKATLHFGSYHDVDSDEVSFRIAASQAFKKGFLQANPVILEPIYSVSVRVPEEYMGDVMGDMSSRRGKISGMDADGSFQMINAKAPLAELYKYSTLLRSLTGGRGTHSMKFSHYEAVPKEVEAKIIAEYEKSKEEE